MNKTLRMLVLLTIVTLMCAGTVTIVLAASNIPTATSDFYVNDFAGVFTDAEKAKLMTNAVTLANEHDGVQVVVTTVKSLEGEAVEDYAYRMYNEYGIGKNDMGLLILLATEDRQIRVEVGRAMEGYVNDAKAGRFMDKYAIPYLKENKFNEGLINLQQAFITEIKSCVTTTGTIDNNSSKDINIGWVSNIFIIVFGVATVGVICYIIVDKVRKKKKEKQEYIQGLKDEISSLNNEIVRLNSTIDTQRRTNDNLKLEKKYMQDEINAKNESLATFRGRHKRILTIYPDADKRVDEMIIAEKVAKDKAAAGEVDELIASVINLTADKDLVGRLEYIQRKIDSLNSDEAKYLKSDMSRFNILCSKCNKLKREYDQKVEEERRKRLTEQRKDKAADITKELLSIIAAVGIVRSSHLAKLRNAKALYDNLDRETRSYVDSSAISKIEEMFRRAKRIKQEEERRSEDEERRRRQASNYSTSSYRPGSSSHGNFGGFGGRSGGGGASRGF